MPATVAPNLLRAPATGAVVVAPRPAPPGRPLDAEEALYLDVSSSQTEVVFQADAEGNWTFLNHAWETLTGFPIAETLGRNFMEWVHPDERAATIAMFEAVVGGGRDVCRHETRYRTADGGYRWVELTSRLMYDENGQPVGNAGTIADIHDRRSAEDALHQSELRRLEVLGRMVQAEDDERRRIATELHDDTIQVMTAALMALDRQRAAIENGSRERALEMLDTVRKTLDQAVDRTRRLTFELRPPLLDVKGLAAAVEELVDQTAEEAALSGSVDARVGRHEASLEALAYRTVAELVSNVRKHARARRLEVSLAERDGRLAVRVSDDGVGFDPSRVPDRRRMRLHLGLDATRERVLLAGGSFALRTAPGHGAAVEFQLPIAGGDVTVAGIIPQ
jgi:PAS domain S-box-containing protein